MNYLRRGFVTGLVGALVVALWPQVSPAQQYPTGPIRLVVGFQPGNAPDIVARLIGEQLSGRLGQPVIVENRAGAASAIAAQTVASAAADGQSLLLITPANAINPNLSASGSFLDGIVPITSIASAPMVIVTGETVEIKTLPDLMQLASTQPGKLIVGSPGTGSTPYLSAVLFKMTTGLDLLHVPFGGTSQAITELLGERIQVAFGDMSAVEFIRSGKVRALAVTSAGRHPMLPDVPAVAEFVKGYQASTWYGIGAPKGTPAAIIDRLHKEITDGMSAEKIKARLASMGLSPESKSPAELSKYIAEEIEKWAAVSKYAIAKR